MYFFGQTLVKDIHFLDHMMHGIPVQVYRQGVHQDIGYIRGISRDYIKVGDYYYSRCLHRFVSRPGY